MPENVLDPSLTAPGETVYLLTDPALYAVIAAGFFALAMFIVLSAWAFQRHPLSRLAETIIGATVVVSGVAAFILGVVSASIGATHDNQTLADNMAREALIEAAGESRDAIKLGLSDLHWRPTWPIDSGLAKSQLEALEEIDRYKRLVDEGAVSQEWYDAARQAVLDYPALYRRSFCHLEGMTRLGNWLWEDPKGCEDEAREAGHD